MKKTYLVRFALFILTILTLSGCICTPYPVDDGYSRGRDYDRSRGGSSGERHDRQRHDGERYDERDDRR